MRSLCFLWPHVSQTCWRHLQPGNTHGGRWHSHEKPALQLKDHKGEAWKGKGLSHGNCPTLTKHQRKHMAWTPPYQQRPNGEPRLPPLLSCSEASPSALLGSWQRRPEGVWDLHPQQMFPPPVVSVEATWGAYTSTPIQDKSPSQLVSMQSPHSPVGSYNGYPSPAWVPKGAEWCAWPFTPHLAVVMWYRSYPHFAHQHGYIR